MSRARRPKPLAAALGALAIMLGAGACGGSDAVELAGYEREPAPTVNDITLPAANRDTDAFAFQAQPGGLLMVYFGFTSCPDVCPTTLADVRLALTELGARSELVEVAFVTVDPDRDTAELTSNYVEAFVADGVALRTDDAEQLAIAADAFGVTYSVQTDDEGDIEVGHTPNVFLVDDAGAIVLTWPFGIPSADMVSDLEILLDRQGART